MSGVPDRRPLQFPADKVWHISRTLRRFGNAQAESISTQDLINTRLIFRYEWYAILSAEGTGKTTLLREIFHELASGMHDLMIVDVLNLGLVGNVDSIESLLKEVDAWIRKVLTQQKRPLRQYNNLENPLTEFSLRLGDIIDDLSADNPTRLLLLFDEFQELPREVAHEFSIQLREIHDEHFKKIICVIAGDDDLDMMRRNTSPLFNIVRAFTLEDFTYQQVETLLEENVPEQSLLFRDDAEIETFWNYTQGYPGLCWRLLHDLLRQKEPINLDIIEKVINTRLKVRDFSWLETAYKFLRWEVRGEYARKSAVELLLRLLDDQKSSRNDLGVETLQLKGLLRVVDEEPTWRNPVVKLYFMARRDALAELVTFEPLPGRILKAMGTIHVSLVLNFRHFVKEKGTFDRFRGSREYEQALDALRDHMIAKMAANEDALFELDDQETKLRQIAAGLNIFRYESAKAAFSPIYQLKDNSFSPSSTLNRRLSIEKMDEFVHALEQEWQHWGRKSIQLTRDGLVHLRLEQEFNESNLLDVLRSAMGLEVDPAQHYDEALEEIRSAFVNGETEKAGELFNDLQQRESLQQFRERQDRSLQWEIAMAMVEMFIQEIFEFSNEFYRFPKENFPETAEDKDIWRLSFIQGGAHPQENGPRGEEPAYPLHDRYVTYVFTKLCDCTEQAQHNSNMCGNYKHNVITWQILNDKSEDSLRYGQEIYSLLEGVVVRDPEGNGNEEDLTRFPNIKEREITEGYKEDLSSWEAELCLLSQDNGVIYYQLWEPSYENLEEADASLSDCSICQKCSCRLSERVKRLHFSNRPNVTYQQYWQCIMRGFEHILNLRLLARLVATTSTDDLIYTARLTGKGTSDPIVLEGIQTLRQHVATNTRLIAHLSDITTPLFIARADYASRKFDHFIMLSGIKETIRNAEKDIQEINTFLQHFDALAARQKADEISKQQHQDALAAQKIAQDSTRQQHQAGMLAQVRAEQLSTIFALIAILLAVFSIPLAIPSFLIDLEQSEWGKWLNTSGWDSRCWQEFNQSCLPTDVDLIDIIQLFSIIILIGLTVWIVATALKIRKLREKNQGNSEPT